MELKAKIKDAKKDKNKFIKQRADLTTHFRTIEERSDTNDLHLQQDIPYHVSLSVMAVKI